MTDVGSKNLVFTFCQMIENVRLRAQKKGRHAEGRVRFRTVDK